MEDACFLDATRDTYDAIVAEYVELTEGLLEASPLDRGLITTLAELVLAGGNRRVADVGCGPGRVTALLCRTGLDAFGIDLSPGMIAHARRSHPDLRFDVGSMLALDLPDESVGGLLAYYSIIHVPWERRPEVFAEFHRVLAPGGHLMLAFQIGDERHHRKEAFGKAIDWTAYRQQPPDVVRLLRDAGFDHWSTSVREAQGPETVPQGFVIVAKG